MSAVPPPTGPLPAFVRFVLCGGGVGLASSFVLAHLGGILPFAVANALVTVVSTVLATELHGRVTFRSRAGWRRHVQSAGTVAVCYLATTLAVLALHAVRPEPGAPLEQAVYLTASATVGVARYVVLRAVVFTGRPSVAPVLKRESVVVAASRRPLLLPGRVPSHGLSQVATWRS